MSLLIIQYSPYGAAVSGNGDDPVFDGDGVETCIAFKDAAAVGTQVTSEAFDGSPGHRVALDTAAVLALAEPYDQLDDTARYTEHGPTPLALYI